MSNSIQFVGRLGKDPELKTVGQSQVLEFSICNTTGYKDKECQNWFQAKYWGKRGEALAPHLSKGKQVFISGELTLRKYTDKAGVEKMSPEINIQALDFIADGKGSAAPRQDDGNMSDEGPF